jgi:hypothetical protein
MTWIADAGLWSAIVLTGLVAGLLAPLGRTASGLPPARAEGLLLAAAAAAVVAWCAVAGEILGAPASSALVSAFVPMDVGPGFRLAVLWSTRPGAALTFGTVLLVCLALSSTRSTGSAAGGRHAFAVAGMALAALGTAAWFNPAPNAVASTIPPFVQSVASALAPLGALVSLMCLARLVARSMTDVPSGAPILYLAWLAATAAIVGEQVARSRLGIGPQDAIVLGSAGSGLVLWLLTSALLHRRVQAVLRRDRHSKATRTGSRLAALAAHAGAASLIISFAAHAFASRATVALPPGVSVNVFDSFRRPWQLVNQGVSRFDAAGVDITALAVQATDPAGGVALLTPQVREYHGRDGQHLSTGTSLRESTGGPAQTIRVLFTEADSLDVASVRVTFLPAPILWPLGVVLLVIAALIALSSTASRPEPSPPAP